MDRSWFAGPPLALAILALSATPGLPGDRSMITHMEIGTQPRLEPELGKLPSIRIDVIQASVPVNDRMNADEAYSRPFVEELKEAMGWYLKQRGLRVVDQGEDLRLAGVIDAFEGWKGWGHWGVDLTVQVKLFKGTSLALKDSLHTFLKYSDDEDVVDEEKPKYKAHDMRVSFQEILFTRVGADLCEKLIAMLKEKAPSATLLQTPPLAASSQERALITIEASAPNAEVYLDGALVGMTPIKDLALPAGTHSLEVRKGGFKPWTREIQVVAGGSTRFFAELIPM